MPYRFTAAILIGIVGLLMSSCAARNAYYQGVNNLVAGGRYSDAAALAEKEKDTVYGQKNALLYYLDRGLLLHLAGSYAESNKAFEKAKKLSLDHYTKSLTAETSTLLISDNMRPYYGEDFERAMVNVFSALNYLMLGNGQEALVEARQADQLLKTFQTNYGYKNVYKEDAFVRYLMGMVYENEGETNEAYISYRLALEVYKEYLKEYGVGAPKELVADAVRTARTLGFKDQIAGIEKDFGKTELTKGATGYGELVVIDYNGFSPEKIDSFFEFSFGWGWAQVGQLETSDDDEAQVEKAGAIARSIASREMVRMAFPKYVPASYRIARLEVFVPGEPAAKGEVAEDIGKIAAKSLDDRIARVRVRAIARSAVKYALARNISQKVEESSGELSGWLAKKLLTVASTATELADKRSWRSLPDKIIIARLNLPVGSHSVSLRYIDASGYEVSSRIIENVEIRSGKKTFRITRSAQ